MHAYYLGSVFCDEKALWILVVFLRALAES